MRFHNSILPRLFLDPEAGEGGVDLGSGGDGGESPFSVAREDWERTQSELNELRSYKDKYGQLEQSHNELREKFKPFLEGGAKDDKSADPEPNPNDPKYGGDRQKYARDLVRWEARQEYAQLSKQREASANEQKEAETKAQEEQKVYKTLSEADTRGQTKYKDYAAALQQSVLPIGKVPGLPKAFSELENPEDVAYHFAKNPQEAYDFLNKVQTSPSAAMRTLILLDHRFAEAAKVQEKKPDAFRPTHKPGGKSGAGESMSDRVKSTVWDEINGR